MNARCKNCGKCRKEGTDEETETRVCGGELREIGGRDGAKTRTMIRNEGAREGSNMVLLYFRREE